MENNHSPLYPDIMFNATLYCGDAHNTFPHLVPEALGCVNTDPPHGVDLRGKDLDGTPLPPRGCFQ